MRVTHVQELTLMMPGEQAARPETSEKAEMSEPLAAVESFDAYYQRDYKSLVGLAFVFTGNRWTAEDLVQDALSEAHRRWHDIGAYDDPGAWVRRVLVNRSTSRFRRLKSEAKMLAKVGARRQDPVALDEPSLEVWEAVRALPKRQAQVIALQYWEDLSVAEIGTIIGCGTETVKTHLKRGRAALAIALANTQSLDGEER